MNTFLHVGCGPKRKDRTTAGFAEWNELRFDIDVAVAPDLVGTMTDMSAVASESVDAVFSSHNIEHLYPHEVSVALAEFLEGGAVGFAVGVGVGVAFAGTFAAAATAAIAIFEATPASAAALVAVVVLLIESVFAAAASDD
mgnify:CR=1 FL=1